MSRWNVVRLQNSLGSHAAAWDALNKASFGNHPLLSSLFVDRLLQEFGSFDEHLCVLSDGMTVRAMLIVRRQSRFVWASFLPTQCQLGPTMVPDARMLETLVANLPGPALQLDLLCNDPQLKGVLHTKQGPIRRMAHALTMSISLEGTFADYWAERPRSLGSNLRRYQRRVEQDGLTARLVRITEHDQLGAALDRYARLETAGWKGRIGTALGSSSSQYRFYEALFHDASKASMAMVYELWLGDKLAASRLVLCGVDMLVMLKTSYDEDLSRYAPGRLLLRAVVEDAFATHPGSTIEFYTDASIDQLEWAGASRWIEHLSLFRNRGTAMAYLALKAGQSLRRLRGRPSEDQETEQASGNGVEVYAKLDDLPPDTRAFLQAAENRNLGFGLDWYRNLVRTVYPDHEGLRFYVMRRNGKPIAVLPLRVERTWLGWSAHSLSNYYTTLYEPVLVANVKGADLLTLFDKLRLDFPSLGSLMLSPMASGSHAYVVLLEALVLCGWFPFQFFAFGNWYQPVHGTWPAYLADRQSDLRSTIKRTGKKFAANGGILAVYTRPEEMPKGIAAYEKVYAASWKRPEPYKGFVPGLLQTCAEKGILRLGVASLNGEPIAVQAWIVSHGRAEIYKLAHDEKFKEYSPGTLVTAMLTQHVMEIDRVSEIDHLIGDDAYKKSWMSERRERWGIVAYNLSTISGLFGFAREALGRSVKYLRSVGKEASTVTRQGLASSKPPTSSTM